MLDRVRRFRHDESGSTLLMTGMMAFLLAIFGLYTLDSYQGVYGRIRAQNAVDAAAETAALTQARGLNLLQHLNSFHYWANWAFFVAESATLLTCLGAPEAAEAELAACTVGLITGPGACAGAQEARDGLCRVCASSSTIDDWQDHMATAVLKMQKGIAKLFPVLAFVYANQVAKQAGAEDLKVVIPDYVAKITERSINWLAQFQIGLPPDSNALSDAIASVGDFLNTSALPKIYAIPTDFDSLSLHVWEEPGDSLFSAPWAWPGFLKGAARVDYWIIGFPSCLLTTANFRDPESGWGWNDFYYKGHPGFMTWVAGVQGRPDWAGLEKMRWLEHATKTGPADTMYVDSVVGSPPRNWVPPFIAFASSQVEGTRLKDHDGSWPLPWTWKADATATLIPVYFSKDFPGTEFPIVPIYH